MGRMTLDELRTKFTPREKVVTLVGDGLLLAEHEAAAEQLAEAMSQTRTSLADGGSVRELGEKVADLEAQIADSTVEIRLRGLGHNAFRRLLAAHATDDTRLYDEVTFPPALIAACATDPALTEQEAADLGDMLTDGQFEAVFNAAMDACREVDGVPFSALASAVTRD